MNMSLVEKDMLEANQEIKLKNDFVNYISP